MFECQLTDTSFEKRVAGEICPANLCVFVILLSTESEQITKRLNKTLNKQKIVQQGICLFVLLFSKDVFAEQVFCFVQRFCSMF